MVERPILFSAPMVRAILDGRKTQTRRVLKNQHPKVIEGGPIRDAAGGQMDYVEPEHDFGKMPFSPGDTLWVREAFARLPKSAYALPKVVDPNDADTAIYYREGFDRSGKITWKPSIHMPRWASRITLKVTAVKVERLQDISEEDARAEGTADYVPDTPDHCIQQGPSWYRGGFKALWTSINGAASWEANPFVAAISFERVEKP